MKVSTKVSIIFNTLDGIITIPSGTELYVEDNIGCFEGYHFDISPEEYTEISKRAS